MLKVKMLRTLPGSEDGITVKIYEADREYDICRDLADNFVGQGAALPVVAPVPVKQEQPVGKAPVGQDEDSGQSARPTETKVVAPAEAKPAGKPGAKPKAAGK